MLIHQNFFCGDEIFLKGVFSAPDLKVELKQPLSCHIFVLHQGLEHTNASELVPPMSDLEHRQ